MQRHPDRGDGETMARGLQQERTALAWERTAIALVVAGALLVRAGRPPYHAVRHVPGWLAILAGASLLVYAFARYGRHRALLRAGGSLTDPPLIRALALLTVGLGVAAAILILVGG